jgi:hypothetical protein
MKATDHSRGSIFGANEHFPPLNVAEIFRAAFAPVRGVIAAATKSAFSSPLGDAGSLTAALAQQMQAVASACATVAVRVRTRVERVVRRVRAGRLTVRAIARRSRRTASRASTSAGSDGPADPPAPAARSSARLLSFRNTVTA